MTQDSASEWHLLICRCCLVGGAYDRIPMAFPLPFESRTSTCRRRRDPWSAWQVGQGSDNAVVTPARVLSPGLYVVDLALARPNRMRSIARSITRITSAAYSGVRYSRSRRLAWDAVNQVGSRCSS